MDNPAEEVQTNLSMLERVVTALTTYATRLEFVVVPSGSRVWN
jgi:hypothetical protein